MDIVIQFFSNLHNLEALIKWGGYLVLAIIIFSESGLLIGFFLPGDSLMVTAGLLASQGYLNFWWLIGLLSLMAVAGDTVGYYFGKVTGPKIFTRDKSIFFAKDHLVKAQKFYDKYGGKTIILARFMPIVRTFAPIVAGVGKMEYKKFISYNVWGGILWVIFTISLGYFLGRVIPNADHYLLIIICLVILASISPGILEYIKHKKNKQA